MDRDKKNEFASRKIRVNNLFQRIWKGKGSRTYTRKLSIMEDNIIHIDTEKFSEEENQWRGDTFEEIVTENFPEFRKCVKTSDSEGF